MLRNAPFFALIFLYMYALDAHLHYPEKTPKAAVLKILPIVWLIVKTFLAQDSDPDFSRYKRFILLGLVVSMAGDVCFVWQDTLFIPGVLIFAVVHIFYTLAFRLQPIGWEAGILCAMSAVVLFNFLLPGIKQTELKYLSFAYSVMIMTMFWRSVVRWQQRSDVGNLAGSLGALLFCISDFIIALDKFRIDVPYASPVIMITYYLAQMCFCMSVTFFGITGQDLQMSSRKEKQG